MSTRCKAVFERGRFFIETGTARGFQAFWENHRTGIVRYIPSFVFLRVQDLMGKGDRDAAVMLWMHACLSADAAPSRLARQVAVGLFHLAVSAMAFYAFLNAVTH